VRPREGQSFVALKSSLWRDPESQSSSATANGSVFEALEGLCGEMGHKTFVAFASADPLLAATIVDACQSSTTAELEYEPW
jgi:hypothetical protein